MKSPTNCTPRARTAALLGACDAMTRAYLVTALWSSTDNADDTGGAPLDSNFSLFDLAPAAVEMARADCARFQEQNAATLAAAVESGEVVCGPDFDEWGRAGHDLWLTRNDREEETPLRAAGLHWRQTGGRTHR